MTYSQTAKSFIHVLLLSSLFWEGGCKELTGSPGLPSGTANPAVYNNATGALGMRNAAVYTFEKSLSQYVIDAGLLTDELEDKTTGASAGILLSGTGVNDGLDERILPDGGSSSNDGRGSYANLQNARAFINQALGALATYDTTPADTAAAKIMRGELYAFAGYTEILLADLYCSGVPLSTLDYQKDFTYAPSSTWDQVYDAALAKLDSALMLAKASDSVTDLALVLKGRVYLAKGNYPAAADDVSTIPDGFLYQVAAVWSGGVYSNGVNINLNAVATVSDSEGITGLPYRSSHDPRIATMGVAVEQQTGDSLYFPAKYSMGLSGTGYAPFTLASGVEARLIQAEAQLQPASSPSGPWLVTLNTLREQVTNIVAMTNMTYTASTALSDMTDPGAGLSGTAAAAARINLLFRERAFWLFLDGHRQGDLRRLLRNYGMQQHVTAFGDQSEVYPTGQYFAIGTGTYGTDVTVPIPSTESANPLFHGCLDRNP